MADGIKKVAYPLIKFLLKRKKHIHAKGGDVSFRLISSENARGSQDYPVIINDSKISDISFSEGCRFFDCVCLGKVKLGRFVTLAGPGVKVCGNVEGIDIGSFTSIGANVVIQEGEHDTRRLTTYFINRNVLGNNITEEISKGKIVIEEGVWIGSNSVILSGVTIGRGAVIGAGSVVTKDIPPYSVCIGAPCKVLRYRFDRQTIDKIETSRWWEMSTEELRKNAPVFSGTDFAELL